MGVTGGFRVTVELQVLLDGALARFTCLISVVKVKDLGWDEMIRPVGFGWVWHGLARRWSSSLHSGAGPGFGWMFESKS